ncbi:MAG: glycosyltransferase involved in cell wall biosynthesis [Planctomycetota bacterium]|jgi:glycosyltransferase involved in cell wall biosynthesis
MSTRRLSGVVACLNNEDTIGLVVNKLVDVCDEVIVVDGGSQDCTLERALVHDSVRLYEQPRASSTAELRNFGFDQCSWDWILVVDADELLGGMTRAALGKVTGLPVMKWFSFPRYRVVERAGELHYLSDPAHFPDRQIRLFRNLPSFRYALSDGATPPVFLKRTGVGLPLRKPQLFQFGVPLQDHEGASAPLPEVSPLLLDQLRGGKSG